MKFQECFEDVPRMFRFQECPQRLFCSEFSEIPQQKTLVNDLDDDEDEPEEDLPKSPATPTKESVNDDLQNFSLSQLNVSFQ